MCPGHRETEVTKVYLFLNFLNLSSHLNHYNLKESELFSDCSSCSYKRIRSCFLFELIPCKNGWLCWWWWFTYDLCSTQRTTGIEITCPLFQTRRVKPMVTCGECNRLLMMAQSLHTNRTGFTRRIHFVLGFSQRVYCVQCVCVWSTVR